ncbi:hypothetical protein [Desulfosporosinus sp. FKB]|uniref:hypothetical protein n=1 Tax=Desulfosporosinus sp. FKB TaxID=1969835 RepID=UPI000B4A321A|nr:hypothetical protein [Desulfosporosinus sp. FKB]
MTSEDELRDKLNIIANSMSTRQLYKVIEFASSLIDQMNKENIALAGDKELIGAKVEKTAKIYTLSNVVKVSDSEPTQKNEKRLRNVEITRFYKFKAFEPGQLQKLYKQFVHFYKEDLLRPGTFGERFRIYLVENGIRYTKELDYEEISNIYDIDTSVSMGFGYNYMSISKVKEFFSIYWLIDAEDVEEVNRLTELVETILEVEQVPENEVFHS